MISPKFIPLRVAPSPPRPLSSAPASPNLLSPRASAAPSAAAAAASPSSLYDVLGVSGAATAGEIRAAYRRLALVSHPDAASSSAAASAAEFMRIHAAYATLSDPHERHAYDRRLLLLAHSRPPPPPMTPRPPPPRPSSAAAFARSPSFPGFHPRPRTWETDQCW